MRNSCWSTTFQGSKLLRSDYSLQAVSGSLFGSLISHRNPWYGGLRRQQVNNRGGTASQITSQANCGQESPLPGCGFEKQPQFSWSIFSPTMLRPLYRIGFKIPGRKNSTMSFWLMGWSTIGMTLPILLLWAWAIWCCYNCNEPLESFANPGKLKMQIGTENWVFRNDFSISASTVMRIVVRYRRVRKTAAEPAFMRKIWQLGRIQKNMAARKN